MPISPNSALNTLVDRSGRLAPRSLWWRGQQLPAAGAPPVTISGVVTATAFTPGSATEPTIAASYYQGAKVCVDANDNGVLRYGRTAATTDAQASSR